MTDNPFAQGDYQHSVSVQGTEADNGWVLTKAQWDQVMAALHQHGIMDANTTLDSPHPDLRTKTVGFGGGFGLLDQDGIRLSSPSRIYWGNVPVPTYPYAEIESDSAFFVSPTSVYLKHLAAHSATDQALITQTADAGSSVSSIGMASSFGGATGTLTVSLVGLLGNTIGTVSLSNAILALASMTADPGNFFDGAMTYRSDLDTFRIYANSIARNLSDDGDWSEKTIASGAITITTSRHTVDTQSDAATDDLDTINGGNDGQLLILVAANGARDVVLTEAGNLKLNGGTFTLDNTEDTIMLVKKGSNWQELTRSSNGA